MRDARPKIRNRTYPTRAVAQSKRNDAWRTMDEDCLDVVLMLRLVGQNIGLEYIGQLSEVKVLLGEVRKDSKHKAQEVILEFAHGEHRYRCILPYGLASGKGRRDTRVWHAIHGALMRFAEFVALGKVKEGGWVDANDLILKDGVLHYTVGMI